ncbi:PolC-type DNA polymerase III domain-containing protein [Cellvibrio japonicus]|uniref:Exonuclease domain-containing protein n=1 Tax=Cellvibrio japonicus (strain Ueda107) TaxID=498211 RepID=B3PJP2_CELJU|nr:hypothetical protein [Cellvibrio japonicus]ACE84299.1 conserved hypothetical protein [Cellvibrio japonicus Ueda107]QEI11323.1 hypothetical protein FY117_03140 [Cellvibrio japonicus]QEI14897.1 hypothetical protein FY116_03140 [Cellvibrio japonicus]QEI18477.1 hypothetical protein FY115_03140 [Cellvibrio japonicus]
MRKHPCPAIIDIEASGFGAHSYPIEIGAVNARGDRYCALIQPQPDWTHWSEQAQRIHGIARELALNSGKPARQVCAELNQFLGAITCYSDAWTHDSPWLTRLFFAGRTNPSFHLSPIELIASEDQLLCWDETKQRLQQQLAIRRHRASGDAYLIQQTYLATRQLANCPTKVAERRAAGKGL